MAFDIKKSWPYLVGGCALVLGYFALKKKSAATSTTTVTAPAPSAAPTTVTTASGQPIDLGNLTINTLGNGGVSIPPTNIITNYSAGNNSGCNSCAQPDNSKFYSGLNDALNSIGAALNQNAVAQQDAALGLGNQSVNTDAIANAMNLQTLAQEKEWLAANTGYYGPYRGYSTAALQFNSDSMVF